jgi:hypothetical protein
MTPISEFYFLLDLEINKHMCRPYLPHIETTVNNFGCWSRLHINLGLDNNHDITYYLIALASTVRPLAPSTTSILAKFCDKNKIKYCLSPTQ